MEKLLKTISVMAVPNWKWNGFKGEAECNLVQNPQEQIKQILGIGEQIKI